MNGLTEDEVKALAGRIHVLNQEIVQKTNELNKITGLMLGGEAKLVANERRRKKVKYLLKVRDLSGRDYNSVLPFDTEDERDQHFVMSVLQDGADEEEVDDLMGQLQMGSVVHEATEYEYLTMEE